MKRARVVGGLVAVAALAALLFARTKRTPEVRVALDRGPLAAPAPDDRGELCADVGAARVCWGKDLAGAGCKDNACVVARTTPAAGAPLDWRCDGTRGARVCEERARNAGAFSCDAKGECAQSTPRMPDDDEWECVDGEGVSYCHKTATASGVVGGAPDLGWTCADRKAGRHERVCVDFSPDKPTPAAWQCTFQYKGAGERVCVLGNAPLVGDACAADNACPRDATCVAGRCVPPRPEATCWLDADCGAHGRCRWGTCVGGGA